MKLETVFKKLSFGALANLSFSEEQSGVIDEQRRPMVVHYINEALTKIYSRFPLLQKDVLVEMYQHITFYHLKKKFAESQWNPDEVRYPYIKDLVDEPFLEDVIKIMGVWDSLGYQLPLNDAEHTQSVFTPQPNVLQVPLPRAGIALSVLYQALHPQITEDDLEQDIEMPVVLEGAFFSYIGHLAYSAMNTEVSLQKSQEQLALYEAACQDAVDNDLVSTSISTTNTRFIKRGWV